MKLMNISEPNSAANARKQQLRHLVLTRGTEQGGMRRFCAKSCANAQAFAQTTHAYPQTTLCILSKSRLIASSVRHLVAAEKEHNPHCAGAQKKWVWQSSDEHSREQFGTIWGHHHTSKCGVSRHERPESSPELCHETLPWNFWFLVSQRYRTRCHPGPSPMPQQCPKTSPKKRAWNANPALDRPNRLLNHGSMSCVANAAGWSMGVQDLRRGGEGKWGHKKYRRISKFGSKKRTSKPRNRTNSTKETSEQFEGKTKVLRQIIRRNLCHKSSLGYFFCPWKVWGRPAGTSPKVFPPLKKVLKRRDLQLPFFEGSLPESGTFPHPYFPRSQGLGWPLQDAIGGREETPWQPGGEDKKGTGHGRRGDRDRVGGLAKQLICLCISPHAWLWLPAQQERLISGYRGSLVTGYHEVMRHAPSHRTQFLNEGEKIQNQMRQDWCSNGSNPYRYICWCTSFSRNGKGYQNKGLCLFEPWVFARPLGASKLVSQRPLRGAKSP